MYQYRSGSTKYSLVQTRASWRVHYITGKQNNDSRNQFRVESPESHLGGAPLVRLGVVSGVGAGPEGAVAGVGEAAAYGAVTGRGVCRGEQAGTLQPCCHHTTSALVLTSSPFYHHHSMQGVHAPDDLTRAALTHHPTGPHTSG